MKIGKTIQSIRTEQHLSQEQFAQLFHVTRQTISNWENEKSYPDLQSLIDMSDHFEISLDEMLKDSPEIVRYIDKKKHSVRWLLMIVLALFLILMGMIFFAFKPTAHHLRNLPDNLPTMYLNLPQATPSRAIVRSFALDDFEEMSQQGREKLYNIVDGQVEGDIPPLRLREGNILRFVFQDSQRNNMTLSEAPKVRIFHEDSVFFTGELSHDDKGWYLEAERNWTKELVTLYLECQYDRYVSVTAFYLVP